MQLPARIGKYELLEFLGGGSSHVFRAQDSVIGRTVAVKILTDAGAADADVKARFLTEARVLGRLQHDHILAIYDFGEEGGRPFMVMEFLQGEDLRKAIQNHHTGDLKNKVRIASEVAGALGYVHANKLVHRDIKPENIHIGRDGTVKLMDFGIAKADDLSLTRAGYVLGTPIYMAPEQVLGKEISALTDIYAFGALLYELITGVRRFQGDSVERIFYSILNESVDAEPMRQAGAPEALCALVVRCMEKDPALRLQDFRAILAELKAVLEPPTLAVQAQPVRETVASPVEAASFLNVPTWVGACALAAGLVVAGVLVLATPGLWPWMVAAGAVLAGGLGLSRFLFHRWSTGDRSEARPIEKEAPLPGPAATVEAPVPPPVPLSPSTGEFTRMFQTAPDPARPGSVVPVPAPVPVAPPTEYEAEATQLFRLEKDAHRPGAVSPAAIAPDVALTITACSDVAFAGRRFPIERFPFRIGRPGGDLVLPFDFAISREHVEIQFSNGGFVIQDMGSSNGTFVNGQRLKPHQPEPLLFGARILLGSNTQLTFAASSLEELPDLTGELVGGRYRLVAKEFASTKSAAYRATDARLPEGPVLVKILSPRLAQQPGYREQFDHEAKIASRLRHPHIIRILDYGETALREPASAKTLYLSMEFLAGGSLAQRLAANQRFDFERVAGWFDKLASSLDYTHGEGVVHGGIKPSSIIFDAGDNPYLSDFAIAVAAGDRSRRTVLGSPAFLAPEQWEGGDLSPATDQYSLAVLLYLVITGSHPYEGQEHPEMRKRNLLRGPVAAHEMAQQNQYPPVPAGVSGVLQRAMATDPSSRFSSAAEFARAFRSALAPQGPTGPKRPYVFISYHRATGSPWVLLFKNELEREYGYEVFIDTEQRDRAGQFPAKLERHIERSDVFVCLLGKGTLESAWVNREIEVAHQRRKPMVPVFQEGFRFPTDMSTVAPHVRELLLFDGVKLLDRQNLYVSSAIESLGEAIRQSLPGRTSG